MSTPLKKPITREMLSKGFTRDKDRNRSILVTLLPGDELEFRMKGTQRKFSIYLGHCFVLAQAMTAEREYKDKMGEYKAKKKAGLKRIRKPKKANIPMSTFYFKAINETTVKS